MAVEPASSSQAQSFRGLPRREPFPAVEGEADRAETADKFLTGVDLHPPTARPGVSVRRDGRSPGLAHRRRLETVRLTAPSVELGLSAEDCRAARVELVIDDVNNRCLAHAGNYGFRATLKRTAVHPGSRSLNIVLALAEVSGIGWITSQCSRTLPPSRRKMSTTASPRGLSDRPCQ